MIRTSYASTGDGERKPRASGDDPAISPLDLPSLS